MQPTTKSHGASEGTPRNRSLSPKDRRDTSASSPLSHALHRATTGECGLRSAPWTCASRVNFARAMQIHPEPAPTSTSRFPAYSSSGTLSSPSMKV